MPNILNSPWGIFLRILAGCCPGEALFLVKLTNGILSMEYLAWNKTSINFKCLFIQQLLTWVWIYELTYSMTKVKAGLTDGIEMTIYGS